MPHIKIIKILSKNQKEKTKENTKNKNHDLFYT
jgi:hypothetical protein